MPEVGPHCIDMTVDSQRSASTVHANRGESRVNDTWLGPVLVAGGVLTPGQLAELAETDTTLWAAVVGAGLATDAHVADAVARRFRVPLANLAAADPRTVTLVPESLARIADLGLGAHECEMMERLLGYREGMLLVTGPTGSGKTTTLYAALNQLKSCGRRPTARPPQLSGRPWGAASGGAKAGNADPVGDRPRARLGGRHIARRVEPRTG
jgi:type IV secretory pathway ATPase VirB11/archaellum biosynthesis ATPase